MAGAAATPRAEEATMRYIFIGLLCLVTLQACSNSKSSGGTSTGSVAYGKIGGGGGSGR